MKTKILAALAVAFAVLGLATPAFAHDVTPTEGSQCTSPTTGEVKFTAQNMGSEVRSIHVFLNGTEVGALLNFTGNGSKKVDITVPQQPAANVTFTWTTDAVAHGSSSIVIDWSKPKCQPEVTTTTVATTVPESTTIATTVPETTTVATTVPETTTVATTVPQTTTTVAQTTTVPVTNPCPGSGCPQDSTTVPATTSTTAAATTTVVLQELPVPLPPVDETVPPTITTEAPPKLPVTGAMTVREIAFAVALMLAGLAALLFSKAVRRA